MADITVRKVRFAFEEPIDFDVPDERLAQILGPLALSMTMPYLEPYLIRTMRTALKEIRDPQLAEDARRFSQQEGHHYRNHARFNDALRRQFHGDTPTKLREIENALEADYQRFTREKPLRFNVAYAEGFEAMTCAAALAMAAHGGFEGASSLPGGELWAWHMAEEIEHRSVAFDVYEHLVGSYLYRLFRGTWAQWHYVSYILRFARCMADGLGRQTRAPRTAMHREAVRRYLRTWSPFYDPSKIVVPPGVDALLARYSALTEGA